MKKIKMEQLFELARRELPPAPPADFATDVLRAARREPTARSPGPASILGPLNSWFPRVGLAAAAIMILCVAVDFGLTAAGWPELGTGTAQVSWQFLFNTEGL